MNIDIDYFSQDFISKEDEDKINEDSNNQDYNELDDNTKDPASKETSDKTKSKGAEVDKTPVEAKSEEAPTEKEVVVDEAPEEAKSEEVPTEEEVGVDEEALEEDKSEEVSKEEEATALEKTNKPSKDELKFSFSNLIGKKIGMTQLFSDEGTVYPSTIIEAGPCSVTQVKNSKNDGYDAVQISFCNIKESKVNKCIKGHFEKSKSTPKKILKEFRISATNNIPNVGDVVDVKQFNTGEYLTISGISKGKGFAGHMKRHGFSGGRASHGKNSVMRKAGSVGAGTDPGRIFPGMKMAGRMGNDRVSIKNLQILNIDYDKNLIFVKGSIPGAKNNYIFLTKTQ